MTAYEPAYQPAYGVDDNSYQAAGELPGLINLCDEFYRLMATSTEAKNIHAMHPGDDALSSKKLAYFLSGWLGGPKLYREHFGAINIFFPHRSFFVNKKTTRFYGF